MSYLEVGTRPHVTAAALAVAALLEDDAVLEARLGGPGRVNSLSAPPFAEARPEDPGVPAARCVVFLPANPFGNLENALGRLSALVIVRFDVARLRRGDYSPQRHAEYLHDAAHDALNGKTPVLSAYGSGRLASPIYRERSPSPAYYVAESAVYRSDAGFRVVVDPS